MLFDLSDTEHTDETPPEAKPTRRLVRRLGMVGLPDECEQLWAALREPTFTAADDKAPQGRAE
eukprot:11187691-Lingulodinium_polyedra.AAC.1